jgi:hypothetical protein
MCLDAALQSGPAGRGCRPWDEASSASLTAPPATWMLGQEFGLVQSLLGSSAFVSAAQNPGVTSQQVQGLAAVGPGQPAPAGRVVYPVNLWGCTLTRG